MTVANGCINQLIIGASPRTRITSCLAFETIRFGIFPLYRQSNDSILVSTYIYNIDT